VTHHNNAHHHLATALGESIALQKSAALAGATDANISEQVAQDISSLVTKIVEMKQNNLAGYQAFLRTDNTEKLDSLLEQLDLKHSAHTGTFIAKDLLSPRAADKQIASMRAQINELELQNAEFARELNKLKYLVSERAPLPLGPGDLCTIC